MSREVHAKEFHTCKFIITLDFLMVIYRPKLYISQICYIRNNTFSYKQITCIYNDFNPHMIFTNQGTAC